jgi:uncharacterized protein YbaP (TraB family)
LHSDLSSVTYERFKRSLAAMGLSTDIFDKLKPSIAAITMELLSLEQAGFNPDYGLDQYLFQRAQHQRKHILFLEPVEFQIHLLANASTNQSETLMKTTLDSGQSKKLLGDIVQAWRTGNLEALELLLMSGPARDSGLRQQMVTDRNLRWLPQIEDLLDGQQDVIVIVGTGHLVGEQGLIDLLKQRGWEVTQE